MAARTLVLALLAAAIVLTGCTTRGHAAMPEQTAFVPGTARPSASASWQALGEAYLVAADRAGRDFDRLFLRRSLYKDTVRDQHTWCDSFMAVDTEFLEDVEVIPWTPDYQVQADAVIEKTKATIAILKDCTEAKTLKSIRKLEVKADDAFLERQKASERLRKDLHLSTRPLR